MQIKRAAAQETTLPAAVCDAHMYRKTVCDADADAALATVMGPSCNSHLPANSRT